jgi:diguanylate cyclase (GGDEF)-like protein
VARLQFDRLLALVPLLYISISIIVLASAIAERGDFPVVYQLVMPGILLIASIGRLLVWTRRRGQPVLLEVVDKQLRITFCITVVLSLVGGLWSVLAFGETHESRRVMAAVFVAFAGLASANCLASLPRAAIAALVLNLAPVSVAMLISDDLGEKALGVCVIVVGMLQLRLVVTQFQTMVQALALQRDMRELADTDPLTSLKNRRALDRRLHEAIAAHQDFSIALLDLDGFKKVNDRHGHALGDALLIQVAERLMAQAGKLDMIARLGGDEFALFMPGTRSDTVLNDAMLGLISLLGLPYICDETWLHVSASVGVARAGKDGATAEDLLKVADRSVYLAKSAIAERRMGAGLTAVTRRHGT